MSDSTPDPEDPASWYADVADALRGKAPEDVARELPGLVDVVAAAPDEEPAHDADVAPTDATPDSYLVGVSFTKEHACLDYAVEAVYADGDPYTETVKPPASERHRYVRFAHPPDPHFDASALRARLLGAVEWERRQAEEPDAPASRFAALWEQL